ncbi:jg82 [Pararge aegeria aegeria]|uniref:Jg82 protein n=1 Tax=Pararge aegeria aegeria TaxID=348720 RepID=A0A8S4QV89_9NEOP|nr:jg82 [Pararge aegeria aegeria]
MASVKIEDSHKLLLEKLLSESGVECIRSASESLEPSTLSAETEEPSPHEVDEEEVKEELIEETTAPISEEYVEEQPKVFPSPSLRKILPDRIRKFEEQNRIHVLPEEFRTDIDPELIPKIALTAQQKYIDILGDITGCVTYKKSLAEFWFLDTLANLLGRAQEDEMSRSSQAVLIQWFCEWMKEIQHFDAADRERMLRRFKDNMLSAARCIAVQHRLPTPQEAGVSYKAEEPTKGASHTAAHDPESKHLVTFEGAAYECSLRDLTCIIHYIFDL